jgi:hypothetical protein
MAVSDGKYFGGSLFTPSLVRRLVNDTSLVANKTLDSLSSSIQNITASFRYDPPSAGIKSTQQLNVDFSQFENHTFFNSAEAKVNTAFDQIINGYPFDGTLSDKEQFSDKLTGFENWVLTQFPTHVGYLQFSGSTGSGGGGSYIKVNDFAGAELPSLSSQVDGKSVIDPKGNDHLSVEMHLFVPSGSTNDNQIICQKATSGTDGFTLALSSSANKSSPSGECDVLFMVSSGSVFYLSASMTVDKGQFNHICAVLNRAPGKNQLELYNDAILQTTSTFALIPAMAINTAPLIIGSGTTHTIAQYTFTPESTLSGAVDEFRVWHQRRDSGRQVADKLRNVYPTNELRLCLKFNEPTGTYDGQSYVIDSSGKALHAKVTNFSTALRLSSTLGTGDPVITSPVLLEKSIDSPVLFASHPDVSNLNSTLLTSASQYDANNPNLITRLIPPHYLLDASLNEAMQGETGNVGNAYSATTDFPGGGKIGSPQLIAALLYTWAKFFDETKVHLDQFGDLVFADYDKFDTVPSQFLSFLAHYHGFVLPSQFSDATIKQFVEGVGLSAGGSASIGNLRHVQNQIWRRILTDMVEITRTKGTHHSIRAVMRDMGINPDKNFRFREYGGVRTGRLTDARLRKETSTRYLDFTGSRGNIASVTTDAQGFHNTRPSFVSPFLTGTRKEAGAPSVQGTMQYAGTPEGGMHGISDSKNDGMFTSGSWTYEALYSMPPITASLRHNQHQSLARIHVTGTDAPATTQAVVANLLAYSGTVSLGNTGSLRLLVRPYFGPSASHVDVSLENVNVFDGGKWHVSFGRERNDMTGSVASSSYFLRAGKSVAGKVAHYHVTSCMLDERAETDSIVFQTTSSYNTSGSFIVIGSQSLSPSTRFLNDTSTFADVIRTTDFSGRVSHIRFWSKALTQAEDREHVRNFRSVGVADPAKNFNFMSAESGSFERLRMDIEIDQHVTQSDGSGNIVLTDFSQNDLHVTASGFEPSTDVVKSTDIIYSHLSPYFDQATADNKVRPRSFNNEENIKEYNAVSTPLYAIPENETPFDDTRFSIEISVAQALNEDIALIFATLEKLDNYIGNPELVFAHDYPSLEYLRQVYFNRLTGKVNFQKFFEFFKWFDDTVGDIVERLVPRKTKFLGVNFVVESHMLERSKYVYNYSDIYLGPSDRNQSRSQLLLQQFVGRVRRY